MTHEVKEADVTVSQDAVLGSAVWAAYGDALGFVTELTDTVGGVRHRCGHERVERPLPWRRRLGGRTGAEVHLPAGAYSDDTQLRLATSRSIRGDGEFDVDSFARVELVAWQSYHLGAGRGSKAAAAAMTRVDARWSQNIFDTKAARYVDVGGNGAAMRIQPHVWASRDMSDVDHLLSRVVRDAVVTHGHPVGIMGAGLHALMLARTLVDGQVPAPSEWPEVVADLARIGKVIEADDELAGLWLPAWENAANASFFPLLTETLDVARDVGAALAQHAMTPSALLEPGYRQAVKDVGGFDAATRGSGLATAWLASYVAHTSQDPARSLAMVANTLGSDTDTIATMAGALLGAVEAVPPPTPVQDQGVIVSEAKRMHAVASGKPAATFRYPDLLTWAPPRSSLDLVGTEGTAAPREGALMLAGLGPLQDLDEPTSAGRKDAPTFYRWATLTRTGQRVLVRHRAAPQPLQTQLLAPAGPAWDDVRNDPHPGGQTPTQPSLRPEKSEAADKRPMKVDPTLFDSESKGPAAPVSSDRSVDAMVARVIESGFDAGVIGQGLLAILGDGSAWHTERAAAFAAVVAREYDRTRRRR